MYNIWGCSRFFTAINSPTYFNYISAFLIPIILSIPQRSNLHHYLLSQRYGKFVSPPDKCQLANPDGLVIKIKLLLDTLQCLLSNTPSISKSYLLFQWSWTQVTLRPLLCNGSYDWMKSDFPAFNKYLALFLSTILTDSALTSFSPYPSWPTVANTLCDFCLTGSLPSWSFDLQCSTYLPELPITHPSWP